MTDKTLNGYDKNQDVQTLVASSILFQGYYLLKAVLENREEITFDDKTLISRAQMESLKAGARRTTEKDLTNLFEMFEKGELKAQGVYELACNLNSGLRQDDRFKSVFERLAKADYNFSVEDAIYTAEVLGKAIR